MNYLRTGILIGILASAGANAFAGMCNSSDVGDFINPAYNTPDYRAQVEVRQASQDTLVFNVVIPCGSKLSPTTLYASCDSDGFYRAIVRHQGGDQCLLGTNPRISIVKNRMTIFTKVRTPGFNGRYEFYR